MSEFAKLVCNNNTIQLLTDGSEWVVRRTTLTDQYQITGPFAEMRSEFNLLSAAIVKGF